jgi:hypothetical protein
MIEEFHPYERCEPGWRLREEFVAIGGDVEVAKSVGEGCHHERGLKGDGVDEEYDGDVRGEEDQICAVALAGGKRHSGSGYEKFLSDHPKVRRQ